MRKKILSIFLFAVLIASVGCRDNEEEDKGALDLFVKAEYLAEPLLFLEPMAYGADQIVLTTSNFFLSDLMLINDSGDEVELADVRFIDFSTTNIDVTSAEKGVELDFTEIPDGNYTHIRFGVGVNPENNTKSFTDFTSDHPLSMSSHYWDAWTSYIFMKLEGKYDVDQDQTFSLPFVFHSGRDENYAIVELPISLSIDGDTERLDITLEHSALFDMDGTLFDITASPLNHQPDLPGIVMLRNNMQSAWNVE